MKSKFENDLAGRISAAAPEPISGHEDRFYNRLLAEGERKKHMRTRRIMYVAVAAASILLLVTITMLFNQSKHEVVTNPQPVNGLADVSYEYARISAFYEQKLSGFERVSNVSDQQIMKLMDETHKLEAEFMVLEKILTGNPSNQRVITAMINNYKFRLQILESIQKYQQMINHHNNENSSSTDM
ncbi:MAG: hypothetical protein JNM00_12175 [Flavobacteriales bacterium]|nr:hypothetical protein [Flavobacteriales bacterium]